MQWHSPYREGGRTITPAIQVHKISYLCHIMLHKTCLQNTHVVETDSHYPQQFHSFCPLALNLVFYRLHMCRIVTLALSVTAVTCVTYCTTTALQVVVCNLPLKVRSTHAAYLPPALKLESGIDHQ